MRGASDRAGRPAAGARCAPASTAGHASRALAARRRLGAGLAGARAAWQGGAALAGLLVAGPAAPAAAALAEFDRFSDSMVLTTQIPGATFTGAIVLAEGVTLNEFEFPAMSGANVASDDGGPMTIAFAGAVRTVAGFVTYRMPLTLTAFDAAGAVVGAATSRFAANGALTGDPGSAPNELIVVTSTVPIARVEIAAGAGGESFTLDDLVFSPIRATAVIEGTEGDDVLVGTPRSDLIAGRGGSDWIHGRGGADIILGGRGRDHIHNAAGNDELYGGEDDDLIFGGVGDDLIEGGPGSDHIRGEGGHDRIDGGAGDDRILGGAGNDVVDGGPGRDRIEGGQGDDVLDGGDDEDEIDGGPGTDTCAGETTTHCEP